MTTPWKGSRWIAVLLLLSSCATAPAPSQPGSAPAATNKVQRVSVICHGGASAALFEDLGVPQGERPIAVALGPQHTYVLFAARLLRVSRQDGKVKAEMTLGKEGESWTAMDVDPADGSVWLASDKFVMRKISPNWTSRAVKLQRVEGDGGFDQLLVAEDALYASPICADDAVWRIDREGKVLGSAFPIPPRDLDEPIPAGELRCSKVRLVRDPQGGVLAWAYNLEKLFTVDRQGNWSETDPALFGGVAPHAPVAKGVDVGSGQEQWYLAGDVGRLFYWKGRPIFLGPMAAGATPGVDRVLLIPDGKGSREVIESCHGSFIMDVATNSTSYAAITERALVLGDLATAPDLP